MGSLKPGVTYIYEKADGVTYAREFGSSDRVEIGRDFDLQLQHELLWKDIHKEAKTNSALQRALDNAIMIYRLSKDNPL